MGDRAWARIIVLKEDKEIIEELMGGDHYFEDSDYDYINENVISYFADEINNGDFDIETDLLLHKISYLREWGDGDDFGAGSEKCILMESGDAKVISLYNEDDGKLYVSDINLAKKEGGWDAVQKLIDDKTELDTTVNWDQQLEIRNKLKVNPSFAIFFDPEFNISNYKDINQVDNNGNTALINTIVLGKYEVFEALLTVSDIEIKNNDGQTALFLAVKNKDVFESILNAGADTLIIDGAANNVDFYLEDSQMISMLEKKRLELEVEHDDTVRIGL